MFIIVTQDLCFKPETFSEDVMNCLWQQLIINEEFYQ